MQFIIPVDSPCANFLFQACLNAPEPAGAENGVDSADVADSPEDVPTGMAPQQQQQQQMQARAAQGHPGYMTAEQQQQMQYYQNLQQQQSGGQYGGMPGVSGRMPQHQQPTV